MTEYARRDIEGLGKHYTKHVSAMTSEGLHSKSDIAAELAWRDAEIERLRLGKAEELSEQERTQRLFGQPFDWRDKKNWADLPANCAMGVIYALDGKRECDEATMRDCAATLLCYYMDENYSQGERIEVLEAEIERLCLGYALLVKSMLNQHGCFPIDRTNPSQRLLNDAMSLAYQLLGVDSQPARDKLFNEAEAERERLRTGEIREGDPVKVENWASNKPADPRLVYLPATCGGYQDGRMIVIYEDGTRQVLHNNALARRVLER